MGRRIQLDGLPATARINTPVELEYHCNGGILPAASRNLTTDQ